MKRFRRVNEFTSKQSSEQSSPFYCHSSHSLVLRCGHRFRCSECDVFRCRCHIINSTWNVRVRGKARGCASALMCSRWKQRTRHSRFGIYSVENSMLHSAFIYGQYFIGTDEREKNAKGKETSSRSCCFQFHTFSFLFLRRLHIIAYSKERIRKALLLRENCSQKYFPWLLLILILSVMH